jgi:hypothetical protein
LRASAIWLASRNGMFFARKLFTVCIAASLLASTYPMTE